MKKHPGYLLKNGLAMALAVILILCSLYGLCQGVCMARRYQIPSLSEEDLATLDLSKTEHLMIVAHPDDEVLWGGGHLQNGGYLVVCITNGYHQTRAAEFQSVMEASGNIGLILSYPDKVAGRRDNWVHVYAQLQSDLTRIITYQSWKDVVTHNASGEYGHIHHKMTHQIVTEIYDNNSLTMPLYVFGKYYRAATLPDVQDTLTPLSDAALQQKESLLALYVSQSSTIATLSHMNPYEMWTQIRGGITNAQTSA